MSTCSSHSPNTLDIYAFALPESVAHGALHPLRQPGDPGEGEC
jgi:hypothetical protein